jgi:hypothetical protein
LFLWTQADIHHLLQEYWPEPSASFSPLLTAIHVNKISIFSRATLNLLLSESKDSGTARLDAKAIHRILRTRAVPEIEAMSEPSATEARGHLIRVILELLCVDDVTEVTNWATTSMSNWYRERPEWKLSFEQRLQQLVGVIYVSHEEIVV